VGTTIRIDDEVYEYLKKEAEAFIDTPNSVLKRLLGIGPVERKGTWVAEPKDSQTLQTGSKNNSKRKQPARKSKRKRVPSSELLPTEEYFLPILESLLKVGGNAQSSEVIELVGINLKDQLTELDNCKTSSGQIRWKGRTQFARLQLIEDGLLDEKAPRGTWRITDAGSERVLSLREEQTND
jgi:hypothetical protein